MYDSPPLRVDQGVVPKVPMAQSVQSDRRGEELPGLGFRCVGVFFFFLDK